LFNGGGRFVFAIENWLPRWLRIRQRALRYDANKPALNHDWLAEPKLRSRGAILCVRPPSSSADFFDAAGFSILAAKNGCVKSKPR